VHLESIQETLRQLRTIPQLREQRTGVYGLLGQTFVQFREVDGKLIAELRKASGSGTDRFPVGTAPEQRKLIDEAKRRAAKIVDDA
jgi:hypothetical protein